jgi:hypothetical protein
MASSPIASIKGLFTSPNPFSQESVPDGACSELNNMVLDEGNVARPRGPFSQYAANLGGAAAANALTFFNGYIVEHDSNGAIKFLQVPATPTWQSIIAATSTIELGTLAGPASGYPVRFCESGGNLYAATKWGVLRIQKLPSSGAYSNLGVRAGVFQPSEWDPVSAGSINTNLAGPLAADSAVAYRCVWCFKDVNGRIVRSAPSPRLVVRHPPLDIQPFGSTGFEFIGAAAGNVTGTRASGSNTIVLTFKSYKNNTHVYEVGDLIAVTYADNEASTFFKSGTYTVSAVSGGSGYGVTQTISYTVNTGVDPNPGSNQTASKLVKVRGPSKAPRIGSVATPPGATTSHFVQLYRSEVTSLASIEPSDEMRLCQEIPYTAPAAFFSDDTVSSLVLGETLYTSPSQGGSANISLPRCKDLVEYQSCLFYLNTELTPRAQVQLLVPGTAADIMELAYNGVSAASINLPDFSGSVFSLSEKVQLSVEYVACNSFRNTVAAPTYFGYSKLNVADISTIGVLVVETSNFDALTFEIRTSMGAATQPPTNPVLPGASTRAGAKSFSDVRQNRLYYSNPQEPEHVAAENFIDIGSANYPILRGVVVQNSLFIIKTDGIFRVTGDGVEWSVEPFDLTKNAVGASTVQVVDNRCYFLAQQGVVELDESGARVVSLPVEIDLAADMAAGGPSLWQSFGTSLEHRYVLIERNWGNTTTNVKAYVFNLKTRGWTTWTIPSVSAVAVDPASGIPYVARGSSGIGVQGRPWVGGLEYGSPLTCTFKLLPITAGRAELMKHFSKLKLLFGPSSGSVTVSVNFSSELVASVSSVSNGINASAASQNLIVPVTRNHARCTQLSAKATLVTSTPFQILGYEPIFQLGVPQKVGHR